MCNCHADAHPLSYKSRVWSTVRGTPSWPLLEPLPVRDATGKTLYRGRLDDLSSSQVHALARQIAGAFSARPETVEQDLRNRGFVPIISDGTFSVVVCPDHSRAIVA